MPAHPSRVELPAGLEARRTLGESWASWLDRLPRLAGELLDAWGLRPDGPPTHGSCSLVLPVVAEGGAAVLKIGLPDDESAHEHLALQRWAGAGAVRLLRADPHRRAMLLERLGPADLTEAWDVEACEVVAGLYGALHVPALPQLRTLASYVERWDADLARLPSDAPLPRRMVEETRALTRDLLASMPGRLVLLHGDLHYANVMAGPAGPTGPTGGDVGRDWLAIDPKPMAGDRHYEPAPMLWNRFDELAGDVRVGLRQRFHTLVDSAGLDEDRARAWVVVRMVHNASWSVADAVRADRALSPDERSWITRCITIAKAVGD